MENNIFQEKKNILESKTFWVNLLVVIGGSLILLAGEIESGATITILGTINIVLRVITKSEITF
jgi:hypothetical protein